MSSKRVSMKPKGGWAKKKAAIEKQHNIGIPQLQAAAALMFKLNDNQTGTADNVEPRQTEPDIIEHANPTLDKVPDPEDNIGSGMSEDLKNSGSDDEQGRPKVKKLKVIKYKQDWEKQYPWLTYNERDGKAYCKYCQSYQLADNKLTEGVSNFSHVTGTKGTWASHDKAKDHIIAKTHYAIHKGGTVLQQICDQGLADALKGRKALLIILDTIRTALRQNLPLRGHIHSESNFDQLTQLLSRHQDDIRWWFERKHRTNFTSGDVIKEMTALVGVSTMRLISTHLRGRKFAFMIDETPDLQGVEQTALIVRTVNAIG